MTLRQKFEWDVNNSPQSAFKEGKFNPNYVEWLEQEYKTEVEHELTELRVENKELRKMVIFLNRNATGFDKESGLHKEMCELWCKLKIRPIGLDRHISKLIEDNFEDLI